MVDNIYVRVGEFAARKFELIWKLMMVMSFNINSTVKFLWWKWKWHHLQCLYFLSSFSNKDFAMQ